MIFVCGSSWSTGIFAKNKSWAEYLGEMLNMEVINYSDTGRGNDFLVRRTMDYFRDNTADLCNKFSPSHWCLDVYRADPS